MGEEVASEHAAWCSGSPHRSCSSSGLLQPQPLAVPPAAPPTHSVTRPAQLCQAAAPQLLARMSIKPGEIVLPAKELFIFLCTQMAGKILAELSKKERAIQCIFPL